MLELVGRALGVPLYRQVISGKAVEQGSEYGGREPACSGGILGDETEDLYELLQTVKVHMLLPMSRRAMCLFLDAGPPSGCPRSLSRSDSFELPASTRGTCVCGYM